MRTDDVLREEIAKHYWFHSIELRPGIVTPGSVRDYSVINATLPRRMDGMSVLDIGCWDGFWSFTCEARGAKEVVASDIWESAGRGAFDLAREELGSGVIPLEASVYHLPEALNGEQFDMVLFLGVLYHLKNPLEALEKVAQCLRPGGVAIVESLIDIDTLLSATPQMLFYPQGKDGDLTTFWAPNLSCLDAMLKSAGFSVVGSVVQCFNGNRTLFHARKASDEQVQEKQELDWRARHSFRKL